MSQAPGQLNPTSQHLAYAMTLPIRLSKWANTTFPKPKIDPVWLAKCCHKYKLARPEVVGNNLNALNYEHLKHFIVERLLRSNLSFSTVSGTGSRLLGSQIMGRLRGPPLLVQIVSVTEILRPKKLRLYKLTLWDGMRLIKAMAFAPTPYCKLGLYDLDLGYKMQLIRPKVQRGTVILEADTIKLLGGKCGRNTEERLFVRSKKCDY